jgi:hypothetical protein
MNVRIGFTAVVFLTGTLSALGQAAPPADANSAASDDAQIAVLRQDLQADKTDVITRSMNFTDAQAKAFWPLYRDYAHQQQVVGDQRVSLLKDYANNYDSIDDATAKSYIQRALKYEDDMLKLRKQYLPKFEKAIGAKQTARFYQVDNRLSLLVSVQLAAMLPMIK